MLRGNIISVIVGWIVNTACEREFESVSRLLCFVTGIGAWVDLLGVMVPGIPKPRVSLMSLLGTETGPNSANEKPRS